MGMNYYINKTQEDGGFHLGKASMGYRFLVNNNSSGVASIEELRALLVNPNTKLFDEYGTEVVGLVLLKRIMNTQGDKVHEEEGIILRSGPVDILLGCKEFC